MGEAPTTLAEAFGLVRASGAPLAERLAAYAEWHRQLNPGMAGAYDRLIERLSAVKAGSRGPRPGDAMPLFVMPDQEGRLVNLETLLAKGPVVLTFNRGHWCSYCRLELQSLGQAHRELADLGAEIVSIVPSCQAYARRLKEQNDLPYRVLSDIDGGYAMSLGLLFHIGEELRSLMGARGVALPDFHCSDGWFLPIPATYVVGVDGKVRARFVDPDFRQRMPVEDIVAALRLETAD